MEIVLDEWICHYVQDAAADHSTLLSFLEKLVEKCDRFVTVRGAALDQKIWVMCRDCYQWSPTACDLARYFIRSIRIDPHKFRTVENEDLADLPPDVEGLVPEDDTYLIKVALAVGAPILTTDRRLRDGLSGQRGLHFLMADEFLTSYDC